MRPDNKSRTKLKSPTISRATSPMAKAQIMNSRICDDPMWN